jgi:thioredoxin-dependent peroxiredoxin
MQKVQIGSVVPDFTLKDQNGRDFILKDVLGKKNLVIYFYPKDDTPGCTKEACAFRDLYDDFSQQDALIIGISTQSSESHRVFAQKYHLNFTLLSDINNMVRDLFGVPTDIFGLLPGRVTYVVDKTGKVVYFFKSQFKPLQHVKEALKILQSQT